MEITQPVLSPIQERVATLIHRGYTNKQIAFHIGISAGTIRNVTYYIYRKIVPGDFSGNSRVFTAVWVEQHKCGSTWPPVETVVIEDPKKDVYDYPKKGVLHA